MLPIEGVDYSTTPPGGEALRQAGKMFVCRYLARDSRGITRSEVNDLMTHGVDIVANHESTADRMKDGQIAGAVDARFANDVLLEVGLPPVQPIYFSCDFDATPEDQTAIDSYLRGVAAVIGPHRVGVYGGFWVIKRCFENGSAQWFWQTYAWSGGQWHHATHIQQYDNYGNTINGTDVDLDRAVKENYGQASRFWFPATRVRAPDLISAQGYKLVRNEPNRFTCIQGGRFRTGPSFLAPNGTPTPYRAGRKYTFGFRTVDKIEGVNWLVSSAGSWAPVTNFVQRRPVIE